MQIVKYRFNSLEDYLISTELNADFRLNDGWGAYYSVKGREIEATVLFADISGFTARTLTMTSTETLAFVNNFFAWMTAEGLRGGSGIVDKYIGDEMMIVFSKQFGSQDPFLEALSAARQMLESDALGFYPHIGIASGIVTVGYVGTPVKYNCSVFGAPVAMAARCASYRVKRETNQYFSTAIVFPETEWIDRKFEDIFLPRAFSNEDAEDIDASPFKLLPPLDAELKNLPPTKLRVIVNSGFRFLSFSVEEGLRKALKTMQQRGRYIPLFEEHRQALSDVVSYDDEEDESTADSVT